MHPGLQLCVNVPVSMSGPHQSGQPLPNRPDCQPSTKLPPSPCSAEALYGMQVAKTVDISHVSPLLAQLGAYDGMVALALAKAKALDPEVVAAQKSEAGRLAREVICCRAYDTVHASV